MTLHLYPQARFDLALRRAAQRSIALREMAGYINPVVCRACATTPRLAAAVPMLLLAPEATQYPLLGEISLLAQAAVPAVLSGFAFLGTIILFATLSVLLSSAQFQPSNPALADAVGFFRQPFFRETPDAFELWDDE